MNGNFSDVCKTEWLPNFPNISATNMSALYYLYYYEARIKLAMYGKKLRL